MDGSGGTAAARRTASPRGIALDVVVAGGVFAYNAPVQGLLTTDPLTDPVAWLVPAALCAPWLWRRTHPVAALAVMLVAALLQTTAGIEPLVADVMLPLGLLAVARRHTWEVSLPATALVVCWALVSFLPRLTDLSLTVGDVGAFAVLCVAAWLAGTLRRTRAAYVRGLHERIAQAEREQAQRERLAAAAERTRIARELHDIVSHHLGAIGLLSDGAAATVSDDPERAASVMRTVRDTSRTAMAEMRSMLSVLRDEDASTDLPAPALADVPTLVADARRTGLPVVLEVTGDLEDVAPGAGLTVYRVVQEALTNARRHAGPDLTRVRVRVEASPEALEVRVDDDGRGRPGPGTAPVGSGLGLVGMRERVHALGGTLHVGPAEHQGFAVHARVPRRPHPEAAATTRRERR
jgi:signal transduction histidine kinase